MISMDRSDFAPKRSKFSVGRPIRFWELSWAVLRVLLPLFQYRLTYFTNMKHAGPMRNSPASKVLLRDHAWARLIHGTAGIAENLDREWGN